MAPNGIASLPFQDPAIMAVGSGPPPPVGQQLFNSAVPLPVPLASSNAAPNGLGAGPNSFGNGKANPTSRTSSTTRAHLTETTFASLPISALTKRAIAEVLCYQTLTKVQAETLPLALQGIDLIAKAKTGTGKTMGFLLPTIERVLAATHSGTRGIHALVISPTRELASQIEEECQQLMTFHKPHLSARVVFGGTNVKTDARDLKAASTPSLVVATPGRLNDLLYNHGVDALCAKLSTLVFDEADQLLEMGFRPDVTKILAKLQPSAPTRQTLLFSATMPQDVMSIAKFATRPTVRRARHPDPDPDPHPNRNPHPHPKPHPKPQPSPHPEQVRMVDTVGEDKSTNAQVEQSVTVSSAAAQPAELLALLRQLMVADFKVIVFFVTARPTRLQP